MHFEFISNFQYYKLSKSSVLIKIFSTVLRKEFLVREPRDGPTTQLKMINPSIATKKVCILNLFQFFNITNCQNLASWLKFFQLVRGRNFWLGNLEMVQLHNLKWLTQPLPRKKYAFWIYFNFSILQIVKTYRLD